MLKAYEWIVVVSVGIVLLMIESRLWLYRL